MEFSLNGSDYIELKALLKVTGLCENGGAAKAAIAEGKVQVNGQVETRKACQIVNGQWVSYRGQKIQVVE